MVSRTARARPQRTSPWSSALDFLTGLQRTSTNAFSGCQVLRIKYLSAVASPALFPWLWSYCQFLKNTCFPDGFWKISRGPPQPILGIFNAMVTLSTRGLEKLVTFLWFASAKIPQYWFNETKQHTDCSLVRSWGTSRPWLCPSIGLIIQIITRFKIMEPIGRWPWLSTALVTVAGSVRRTDLYVICMFKVRNSFPWLCQGSSTDIPRELCWGSCIDSDIASKDSGVFFKPPCQARKGGLVLKDRLAAPQRQSATR